VALVLSIGVAALMFSASGYADVTGSDPTAGLGPVGENVETQANESAVNSGVEGAASGSDEPLINFILSGGGALLTTAKLVVSLPQALQGLGFPVWFARPVGFFVTIGTGIGIIQFISGRIYQ
jgi:hypothetical protein